MKAKFKAAFMYGTVGNNIILEADSNTPLKSLFEKNIGKYNGMYKDGCPSEWVEPHEIPETAKAVSAQVSSHFVKKLGSVKPKWPTVKLTSTTTLQDVLDSVQDERVTLTATDLNDYANVSSVDASIFVQFK